MFLKENKCCVHFKSCNPIFMKRRQQILQVSINHSLSKCLAKWSSLLWSHLIRQSPHIGIHTQCPKLSSKLLFLNPTLCYATIALLTFLFMCFSSQKFQAFLTLKPPSLKIYFIRRLQSRRTHQQCCTHELQQLSHLQKPCTESQSTLLPGKAHESPSLTGELLTTDDFWGESWFYLGVCFRVGQACSGGQPHIHEYR